jgi:hypothetical protein
VYFIFISGSFTLSVVYPVVRYFGDGGIIIIIIISVISYALLTGFSWYFPLEPVVNPTTQASRF